MVCLLGNKPPEAQWLRAVKGHGLRRPHELGVRGARLGSSGGCGGLEDPLPRCSAGGLRPRHVGLSMGLSMEDPSPASAALRARGRTWRASGGAPASQLATWGLWFQGPATRAPQDATGGSGVGVREEAGGATPSGEQPLLPHHAPRLSITHAFNGPTPTCRTPLQRARHTGVGVRTRAPAVLTSRGRLKTPASPAFPCSKSPGTEETNRLGMGAC